MVAVEPSIIMDNLSYMGRAVDLAKKAIGSVSPNPPVGAVLVKNRKIVGEGWTQPPGQNHAEIEAIMMAGREASGAVLYTTLEPCNYVGRTGACTEAIINAGISEVIVAVIDSNPVVNGSGISRLSQVGIVVSTDDTVEEAKRLTEAYTKYVTTSKPFVTAKFAMSLDGKIATKTGSSRWITGNKARSYSHQLRAMSDAVMVGVNTIISDDSRLTARSGDGAALSNSPLRIVVDSQGRISRNSALFSEPGSVLIATALDSNAANSLSLGLDVSVISIPGSDGRVDLPALLNYLGDNEITSLLVEGGGELLGSLFDLQLVDKVCAFIAPSIIGGGSKAVSAVGGDGIAQISDASILENSKIVKLGDDFLFNAYCRNTK